MTTAKLFCSFIAGLLDDDFGMELLVAGNIISLSLPVRLVFEAVWLPHLRARQPSTPTAAAAAAEAAAAQQPAAALGRGETQVVGPPMTVTFRLQV